MRNNCFSKVLKLDPAAMLVKSCAICFASPDLDIRDIPSVFGRFNHHPSNHPKRSARYDQMINHTYATSTENLKARDFQ